MIAQAREDLPGKVRCVQYWPVTRRETFCIKYPEDEVGEEADVKDCALCKHKLACLIDPEGDTIYSPVAQR